MNNLILTIVFSALVLNAGPAFARASGDYSQDGWLNSFHVDREDKQPPAPAEPEPALSESASPESTEPEAQTPVEPEPGQEPAAAQPAQPVRETEPGLLPEDYDLKKASLLARTALRNNIGYFSGKCYEFVANFMEWSSIIKGWQWSSLGIGPNHAADFAAWANANPVALRKQLSLVRMETPGKVADLPLGGIVVYQRGVCGFSKKAGHIEVVVAPNRLCSDGCQSFEASCLSNPSVRSRISVYVPVKKSAAAPQYLN